MKSVNFAYRFATFLQTPSSISIDEHDNNYMINWPYFCIETSTKSIVTTLALKSVTTAYGFATFLKTPYSTSNDHMHSNLSSTNHSNHSLMHHSNQLHHLDINKKPPCSLRSLWGLINLAFPLLLAIFAPATPFLKVQKRQWNNK